MAQVMHIWCSFGILNHLALTQVLIMIDFIYLINTWLLERDHCLPGLVIGTLITYIGEQLPSR